jgi:hypothetical protein
LLGRYLVLGRPVLPRNRLALRREELPHLDKLGNAVAPELYAGRNTELVELFVACDVAGDLAN